MAAENEALRFEQATRDDTELFHLVFGDERDLFTLWSTDIGAIEQKLLPSTDAIENGLLDDEKGSVSSNESSSYDGMEVEEDATPHGYGKGMGPRSPKEKRNPYKSYFWRYYIKAGDLALPGDIESIWNEDSWRGKSFRRRFSLPR